MIDRKVRHYEPLDTGFNAKAVPLRQYLSVVLENEQASFYGLRDFSLMAFIVMPKGNVLCTGVIEEPF